jgi:hypothetical protein
MPVTVLNTVNTQVSRDQGLLIFAEDQTIWDLGTWGWKDLFFKSHAPAIYHSGSTEDKSSNAHFLLRPLEQRRPLL